VTFVDISRSNVL